MNLKNKTFQQTLNDIISVSGIGLFSGEKVKIKLIPQKEDFGIAFKRIDKDENIKIKADLNFVVDSNRRTTIGVDNITVQMVEHILSALKAYQIDNVLIEVEGSEIPVIDGSSKFFAEKIEEVGIKLQKKEKKIFNLKKPIYFSKGSAHLIALPCEEFKISYTFHHPSSKLLSSQYYSYKVSSQTYKKEIAPSRTFSIYEEIKTLLDNNLIRGGDLNNAVLIKNDKVLNPGGTRFDEEMVRHKILDIIGDLTLIGKDFNAHIIGIKAGHAYNIEFAKLIEQNLI
ncbi:MAG: UDP-3-O-acyl-N-acetylglucosamine deacetylase [Candidatus Anoxychlamydiales bacterium]|nr:UDP-3-O-acyl-N-acetylglucosamine deacetylase [Candidatus Anoxychlamydiales bacterium]